MPAYLKYFMFAALLLIPLACYSHFLDNYGTAKWCVLYLVTVFVLGHRLANRRVTVIPAIPLYVGGALFFLIAAVFLASGNVTGVATDLACLVILSFEFSNQFKRSEKTLEKIDAANLVAVSLVTLYGFLQIAGLEIYPELLHNEFPVSTFGYQNITAEFLGLSILLQLVLMKRLSGARFLVTGTSILYFLLLNSRTNQLALGISTIIFVFYRSKEWSRATIIRSAVFFGALLFLLVLALAWLGPRAQVPLFNSGVNAAKRFTPNLRIKRWANTWEMIKKKPEGVGFGNFEFAYLPFKKAKFDDVEVNEKMVAQTPHNEFLRAVAEGGMPFGFSVALALVAVGLLIQRMDRRSVRSALAIALATYLTVDAVFDFPFSGAFSFLCTAMAVGSAFSFVRSSSKEMGHRAFLYSGAALWLMLSWETGAFIYAELIQANAGEDCVQTKLACQIAPYQWKVCLEWAQLEAQKNNLATARWAIKNVLNRNPSNFVALKAYYQLLAVSKLPVEACQVLSRYQTLLGEDNSLTYDWRRDCSQGSVPEIKCDGKARRVSIRSQRR